MCDSVYAAEVYDLVCTCGMTEGPHIGELFCHDLQQKLFILQGQYLSLDKICAHLGLLFLQHKGLFYKE